MDVLTLMLLAQHVQMILPHVFQHAKFNFGMIPGRKPAKHAMLIAGIHAYGLATPRTVLHVTTCNAQPATISTLAPRPNAPPA